MKYINRDLQIDYVEEENGLFRGFEFKWNPDTKLKQVSQFIEKYKGTVSIVNPNNIDWFLSGQKE